MTDLNPDHVLLFCGKRKSGKDYLTDRLDEILDAKKPKQSKIIKLSGPLKQCYAQDHNLDYNELLSAGPYKEKHRLAMIKWSEEIRNKDYGYFCRAALKHYEAEKYSIWIISDCRRKTDFKFFQELFGDKCLTIRISASLEVRQQRGYSFQPGVDDAESECGLDDVEHFDFDLINNGDQSVETILSDIVMKIQ